MPGKNRGKFETEMRRVERAKFDGSFWKDNVLCCGDPIGRHQAVRGADTGEEIKKLAKKKWFDVQKFKPKRRKKSSARKMARRCQPPQRNNDRRWWL